MHNTQFEASTRKKAYSGKWIASLQEIEGIKNVLFKQTLELSVNKV